MRYREDPAVIEYLQAENDYLDEIMQHTKSLQAQLYEEMKARIKEDDETVPAKHGDYYYYTRTAAGLQYPYYCRKQGSLKLLRKSYWIRMPWLREKLSAGLALCGVSPDHKKLAYSVDPDGTEKCIIYTKDLTTGQHFPEEIPNTAGDVYTHTGIEWASNNQTFFYTIRDEALRPYKIYRHVLGTDPSKDEVVFHEVDETYYLSLGKTRSQAYITAFSGSTLTTEVSILPAEQPQGSFQIFEPRQQGIEYEIDHLGEHFFIITNEDANNFKLMETPISATGKSNWREVIAHRPGRLYFWD